MVPPATFSGIPAHAVLKHAIPTPNVPAPPVLAPTVPAHIVPAPTVPAPTFPSAGVPIAASIATGLIPCDATSTPAYAAELLARTTAVTNANGNPTADALELHFIVIVALALVLR